MITSFERAAIEQAADRITADMRPLTAAEIEHIAVLLAPVAESRRHPMERAA